MSRQPPLRNPKDREVTPLLRQDPQVWVLMRAVMEVKERGEKVVLEDIAEMVNRGSWECAKFWAEAVDAARGLTQATYPDRGVPPLETVLEAMSGALSAYRTVLKKDTTA